MSWIEGWVNRGRRLGRRELAIRIYKLLLKGVQEDWSEERKERELTIILDNPDGVLEDVTVEELMRELSHG